VRKTPHIRRPTELCRILVIRLSSLGDVVLTIPVFKRLRDAYPSAHIAALVKEAYADILKEESSINEVITLAKGEPLLNLCRRVRRAGFDGVLDLHANLRSRILAWCSGASKVTRYRKAAMARRLFVQWRFGADTLKEHTLDRYMDAASRFLPKEGLALKAAPAKILIIQTAFLGDAVLTTPLVGALHDQFPTSKLTILCTPEIAEVFVRHPAVSEIVLFDKRGLERSWRSKWKLVRRLKKMQLDMAIIPHRSATSALIAYLAAIPRRIGFSASQGRWFLTDIVPFQWGVHDVERNLALLKVFGVQNPSRDLWLKPEPEAVQRVTDKLRSAGVGPFDKVVGINAGSVWATKRWLPEGFAAVADRLIREAGAKVVFTGGARDSDTVRQILSLMKEKPVNWVGETTLKELIAVISRCQVFLTNDSGPLHIAVATRVRTVAIFGPTTRELGFFPYGAGHTVIEKDLPCRPCSLHGAAQCPLEHFQCMKLVTPEEVFEAVQAQMSKGNNATAAVSA
jgi:lipopolysaccharide heptosyltransferase II